MSAWRQSSKWLAGTLVAVLALLAASYGLSPWVAQQVATQQLAEADLTLTNLEVRRPEATTWVIPHLAFAGTFGQVDIRDAVVRFSPAALADGQVDAITLASVHVRLLSQPTATSATSPPDFAAIARIVAERWAQIPAEQLTIEQLDINYHPVSFRGSLAYGRNAAQIEGATSGTEPAHHHQIVLEARPTGDITFKAQSTSEPDNRIRFAGNLAEARGLLEADWTLAADDMMVTVTGGGTIAETGGRWRLEPAFDAAIRQAGLDARIALEHVEGTWPLATLGLAGGWAATFDLDNMKTDTQGSFHAEIETTADQSASRVVLHVRDGSGARVEFADEYLPLQKITVDLTNTPRLVIDLDAMALRAPETRADVTVYAELDAGPLSHTAELKLFDFSATSETTAARVAVALPGLGLDAAGQVDAHLADETGRLALDGNWRLDQPLLQSVFQATRTYGYDLDAGSLSIASAIELTGYANPRIKGNINFDLEDGSAHYDDVTAHGISGHFETVVDEDGWRLRGTELRCADADVGFPLTDLAATLSYREPELVLRDLSGKTLGGRFAANPVRYNSDRKAGSFDLALADLALGEILALEGDAIDGTGRIDGRLPIRIIEGAATVDDGTVSAQAPGGVIRYAGAQDVAGSLGQPGLEFAVTALADFRYERLDANVSYDSDGDLLLAVRLEGHNPAFERGRPIHYNLNVTENIPTLLRSLQLADDVTRQIERRINR